MSPDALPEVAGTGAGWALLGAVGAGLLLPARLALAAAAGLLLYRALREERSEPAVVKPAADRMRRVLFALLGAAILFQLTGRLAPAPARGAAGAAFQEYLRGLILFRLWHGLPAGMPPPHVDLRREALRHLERAATLAPESVAFARAYGIALAASSDPGKALAVLEAAGNRLARRAPAQAARERRIWHALFGPDPNPARVAAARQELAALRLGWLGDVAALQGALRAGDRVAVRELEARVRTGAQRALGRLILAGILVLAVLQLGVISLFVGIVLIATKVLAPAPRRQHPVSAILWEGFLLYLALGMAPGLLLRGRHLAPEGDAGLLATAILAADAVQALAILYLAWRLRARGLSLAEIGLSPRGLGAHLLVGAMAAMVLIPAVAAVTYATTRISDRYFPNLAPPYHPLQGLVATSPSAAVRLALFVAAAVAAPILEEVFFRGALFGALRRRIGFGWALVASSAFFAILHPQLPLGFVPIALLGAAFATLYEWRQSLWPAIVAHALNNGLAFALLQLLFPIGS